MTIWFLSFAVLSVALVLVTHQKTQEPSTFAAYAPTATVSEVNSNPESWTGKRVRVGGVLETSVLEDDAVIEIMSIHLVDNSTSDAIYVYSGLESNLDHLFGKPVIVTGYCEKIETVDHFGTHRTRYFLLPVDIEQASP